MNASVLLVDDEPLVTRGLRLALRHEPFRVFTAGSAEEALALLAWQAMDVVISDEKMPGMRGTDLLAEVRHRSPRTLRMLLTGQTSLQLVIRAVNEGQIHHFFSKPCQAADLARVVRQALRLRDLERKSAGLDEQSRRQAALLQQLEADHPGIGDVRRDASGAILLDEDAGPDRPTR